MSRIAVIDVGTNSVKVSIADSEPNGSIEIIAEETIISRLGEGVDKNGSLKQEAMERTLSAIEHLVDKAKELDTRSIAAIGTSALRDASNGIDFLLKVKENTGVALEIIAGQREAELAYKAVMSDPAFRASDDNPVVVFDTGGGSTEVNIAQAGEIQYHHSFNIGAVRLTERHFHSDPPSLESIEVAKNQASDLFSQISFAGPAPSIIGIGGTVTNTASVIIGVSGQAHGVSLKRNKIEETLKALASVNLEERKKTPGLDPARADVIIGGIVVVLSLLDRFEATQMRVSSKGLRYGLLSELAAQKLHD
jgi:exopolyphosphatase/guanosine-5'-triphosphate,3'-diphosphate pyrophosphatase